MNHIAASIPTDTAAAAMDRARQFFLTEWTRFVASTDSDAAMAELEATGKAMWGILQMAKPRA